MMYLYILYINVIQYSCIDLYCETESSQDRKLKILAGLVMFIIVDTYWTNSNRGFIDRNP